MQSSKLQFKIKNSKNSAGFTLIELILTITIIGILAGVLIILINPAQQLKKARDSQRKSDLRQIQVSLEMYRTDNGAYPDAASNILAANCPAGGPYVSFGNALCTTIYLQKIPVDPSTSGSYMYFKSGYMYCLRTCLENTNDLQKDPTNDTVSGCSFTVNCSTTSKSSYTLQNP